MEMLDSVKVEFESNERLAEDFPEICYPVEKLDGIVNRCAGQLYHGERTRISWTANEITLPTIAGSIASGCTLRCAGLTGRLRGMKVKKADGKSIRPSLVIIDDPQTRESAESPEQNRTRVNILSGDILGLAGPGQKISGIMPCTVIAPGDMADQILDREEHPEWNGERMKLMYSEPENKELWNQYAEIRAESLRMNGNISDATEFYRKNREAMDKGASVAWPCRFNIDELSAIQNAMDLKIQDEEAFAAEYQNEPLVREIGEKMITIPEICGKLNKVPRSVLPMKTEHLTMFVDVQKTLLFYAVCAWGDDSTGAVIEYGAFPEQRARMFTLEKARPTFQEKFPGLTLEGQINASLEALFSEKMGKAYLREDEAEFYIERAAIDAGWGASTETIYNFCSRNVKQYGNKIMPSHGKYIGAASKQISSWRRYAGEKIGNEWALKRDQRYGNRRTFHVLYDTNYWKTFIHQRLSMNPADPGSLSLYGDKMTEHELLANHLTAEYKVKTAGMGRIVDEWKIHKENADNHWFDCLVGCAVLASIQGVKTHPDGTAGGKPKRMNAYHRKLSDIQNGITYGNGTQSVSMPSRRLSLSDLQRMRGA